ncbi:MAG: EAL domain-containing protein [Aestuariibacter sp.]
MDLTNASDQYENEEIQFVYDCKLLFVDDERITTDILESIFSPIGFLTKSLNNNEYLFDTIVDYEPDLIILDINMPGKNGFEISKELKSHKQFRHIAIILLTSMDDKSSIVHGLSLGVEDYVTKPFYKGELVARVINHLKLKKQTDFLRANKQVFDGQFDNLGIPLQNTFNNLLQRRANKSLKFLSVALVSVAKFDEMVASIECDDGKSRLKKAIFEKLIHLADSHVFIGSCGDGKFGLLIDCQSIDLKTFLQTVKEHLESGIIVSDQKIKIKVHIGYYQSSQHDGHWKDLIDKAELALIDARSTDTNPIISYSPKRHDMFNEKWWIFHHLEDAIAKKEFEVYYQPQFNLSTHECIGYEALLRWIHPERGFISPGKFISIAEEYGLIHEIGEWVIHSVTHNAKNLLHSNVALNISPIQLMDARLPDKITDIIDAEHIDINHIELELTESAIMDKGCFKNLERLFSLGYNIAIDDFGTGYSNLCLLSQLPFSKIKIDRSLVMDIESTGKTTEIIRALVNLGQQMELSILAEGVETKAQAEILTALGVQQVQGFYFGRPVNLETIQAQLKHNTVS